MSAPSSRILVLVLVLSAVLAVSAAPAPGTLPAAPGFEDAAQPADGIARLIARLQQALDAGDLTASSVFAPGAAAAQFGLDAQQHGGVVRVVRERSRALLPASGGVEASRLTLDVFEDDAGRGRLITAGVTAQRPEASGADAWRITAVEELGALDGLFRLRLDTSTLYSARDLVITAPDLTLTLGEGVVVPITSSGGVTGAVLMGRGEMRFTPAPAGERGQVRLFAGREALVEEFESALIRFSPFDAASMLPASALDPASIDPRLARRAAGIAARELPLSFAVDVDAFGAGDWHLLPAAGDLVAEIRTRRRGVLTFSRVAAQAEDIALARRSRPLIIARYRSAAKLEAEGRFFSEDALREYDVLDYHVDAAVAPGRRTLQGRVRLALRTLTSISALTVRLADALSITSVATAEGAALGFVRLKDQHAVYIRLAEPLPAGASLTLAMTYGGPVESEPLDNESVIDVPRSALANLEPHLLQSSSSYWYPQNPFTDYATATLRIAVPDGYGCVGTGRPVASASTGAAAEGGTVCEFRAERPVKHLAFVVSRLSPVELAREPVQAARGQPGDPVELTLYANPLIRPKAREATRAAGAIVRFYTSLIGETPYPTLALAVVEAHLPGGHSPAHFVLLRSPVESFNLSWRNDPAAFPGFSEFFLAHEVAHQWWGQAVSGNSYHEAWISEGFAQYFAALYAQEARGEDAFHDMLRQFRRWGLAESPSGPVHLGDRLGQIEGDPHVRRALVYNKGASILHMLRRIVGDEAFFGALRGFYERHRFGTAGTLDVQRAFERESGLSLERFFERWIYGDTVPRVSYTTSLEPEAVTVLLEQHGDEVFDLPVTIRLIHADGRTRDEVIVMTERRVEQRFETGGRVRRMEINGDGGALATFDERR